MIQSLKWFYSNDPVDVMGHMQRGNSIANGFNRYTYANNNPYKYTDPDGKYPRGGAHPPPRVANSQQIIAGVKGNLDATKDAYEKVAIISSVGGSVTAPITIGSTIMALGAEVLSASLSETPTQDSAIVVAGEMVGGALVNKVAKPIDAAIEAIPNAIAKKIGESIVSMATEGTSQATGDALKETMQETVEKAPN